MYSLVILYTNVSVMRWSMITIFAKNTELIARIQVNNLVLYAITMLNTNTR